MRLALCKFKETLCLYLGRYELYDFISIHVYDLGTKMFIFGILNYSIMY